MQYQSERGSGRRVHFTHEQFETLITTSQKRINELENLTGQYRGLKTNQLWARRLLQHLMIFTLSSGVRIDELKTIRWKDIDWDEKKVKLHSAGKTDNNRTFVVTGFGMKSLKFLLRERINYLGGEDFNVDDFDEEQRIQSYPNGKFVRSLKGSFRNLLKECGFKYKEDGSDKHTLTSLRHSYATFRLTSKRNKASLRALAKQMGTSEKMIEKHYGHDTVEDYRSELIFGDYED